MPRRKIKCLRAYSLNTMAYYLDRGVALITSSSFAENGSARELFRRQIRLGSAPLNENIWLLPFVSETEVEDWAVRMEMANDIFVATKTMRGPRKNGLVCYLNNQLPDDGELDEKHVLLRVSGRDFMLDKAHMPVEPLVIGYRCEEAVTGKFTVPGAEAVFLLRRGRDYRLRLRYLKKRSKRLSCGEEYWKQTTRQLVVPAEDGVLPSLEAR